MRFVLGGEWAKRVEHAFVISRDEQAALYAEFFHSTCKAKAIHQHTYAAYHAGFVYKNLVGCYGNVVRTRGTAIAYDCIEWLFVFGLHAQQLIVDDA